MISILEGQLANGTWLLGDDFPLVECAYGPVLQVIEKTGVSCEEFPKVRASMEAIRSRPAWQDTSQASGT